MFIVPKFPRPLLRSEERTDLCICVRRSVRSSERSRRWIRLAFYKHVASPGQGSAANFGAMSSEFPRSHKDAEETHQIFSKLFYGDLNYHSYVANIRTCRAGDNCVTESLKETKRIASLQK